MRGLSRAAGRPGGSFRRETPQTQYRPSSKISYDQREGPDAQRTLEGSHAPAVHPGTRCPAPHGEAYPDPGAVVTQSKGEHRVLKLAVPPHKVSWLQTTRAGVRDEALRSSRFRQGFRVRQVSSNLSTRTVSDRRFRTNTPRALKRSPESLAMMSVCLNRTT